MIQMVEKIELAAIIDVGSNRLTMKIAEISGQHKPRVVEQVRGSLALGEDTYTLGRIREENIRRCCTILHEFKQKLKEYKIKQVKVVATSAIREASNRDYVTMRIRQETGFDVVILDNSMERYYHQEAMTERLPQFRDLIRDGVIVVDIGAGSVQISSYNAEGLIYSHNLLLGALRVHEMLDRLRDRTRNFTALLDEYIAAELGDLRILEEEQTAAKHIIVLGPQVNYLKKLAGLKKSHEHMNLDLFEQLLETLREEPPIELTTAHGIPAHEAELLLPAATLLERFVRDSASSEILMPQADLSDGLLRVHIGSKHQGKDDYNHEHDIITSTRHIAKRFRIDEAHTNLVQAYATTIFDVLAKRYNMNGRHRLYLELATILHAVGKYIRINPYDMQSFHIIRNLDLFGLADREQLVVASIARFQAQQGLPSLGDLTGLEGEERLVVLQLTAILRIADALDASYTQKMPVLHARLKDKFLQIDIDNSIDTTLETSVTDERAKLLADVFGLSLNYRYRPHEYFV